MINMKPRLKPGSLAKTLIVALALLVPSIAQAAGWGLWVDRGYGFRFEGRFERFENCDNAARMQAQARAKAGCREMEEGGSPNTAIIRFTPGQPIYVDVRVNGRVPARLVLDTGADSTVIRPDVLRVADARGPKGTARMRGDGTGSERGRLSRCLARGGPRQGRRAERAFLRHRPPGHRRAPRPRLPRPVHRHHRPRRWPRHAQSEAMSTSDPLHGTRYLGRGGWDSAPCAFWAASRADCEYPSSS